jgi:hypothetical protein
MSDNANSGDSKNENEREQESLKPVSEEEGLKSAESLFKSERKKNEDSSLDEDEEFFNKYLKCLKKAKDIGLADPSFTTIYYQGGVHFANSNVNNNGNVAGNDQAIHSNTNTGGLSGEVRDTTSKENAESIESVFDRSEDIKQRSFMIALAVLNDCNYRIVIETSQRLQSIIQSQAGVETKA